ncbi:MAG: hypothetical protein IKT32_02695 [Clostridia bacterium]|nr:hypothetical protein [Clostridia bacterium]
MNARHYECIEAMIANPSASYVELAEIVGCNRNTITEWKRNPIFMEEYHRRLREVWKDSEAIAVKTMIKLAEDGSFQASKYILDSQGYAPAQKIEADVKQQNIIISIDE